MTNQIRIRKIEVADASSLAELNQALGYQTSSSLVQSQLHTILSKSDHYGYVAIIDHQIVGYIHAFIATRLTTESFVEIGALIVDEMHRKKGVGSKLVDHLEQEINEIEKIRVRCNIRRDAAHKFYLTLNYLEHKEQKVFEKQLNNTAPKSADL